MFNVWGNNIRNRKLTIKSFLEENLVEEKPNSYISLQTPSSNSLPELVNIVERFAASLSKDQIITTVIDILPRAQACIVSDGGAFQYKLKSSKRKFNR